MAIYYDKENKLFHLKTPGSSYIFSLHGSGLLRHIYYGKRIDDITGLSDAIPGTTLGWNGTAGDYDSKGEYWSSDALPQEYAFYGSTDLRKPSFHAILSDGDRITKPVYQGHSIFASKPKLEGLPATYTESDSESQTLEIEMKDEKSGLVLIYRYSVFEEHDAIARSVTAKNTGSESIDISAIMSASVDFVGSDFDFIHLWGAWARERHIERTPLVRGNIHIESRRGASSHYHSPFFALAKKDADENHGDVYGFSLLYSGNFEAGVENDCMYSSRAYIGINSFDFNWRLEPGEQFDVPEAVMVYSSRGLGEMSRTYHRLFRTRLARGKFRSAERPVLINNWEATYFDFNEEKILDIAKTAKKAGIELMVLDDGWFGKRNHDDCSLGDWSVNRDKLPSGIDGLARKINDIGMKFGLWFEPEMVSPDSDLYRAHPDWCIAAPGRGKSEARLQFVLDLSRADVCDYIISFMSQHLESAPISYIKWDMNRYMTEIGSAKLPPERQQETAHRYMLGLYRILEELKTRFPDVLMEGCASGGGRFDPGMMYYFDQYWTSDDTDALERLYIQHGTSLVLPPIFMGAHVSEVPNHQTGRTTPFKMRADAALCGQFGYELDITKMTEEELCQIKEQIRLYKSVGSVIHNGDMYRLLSPFEEDRTAWEFISEDKNTVVLLCFIASAHANFPAGTIFPTALDAKSIYRLRGTDKTFSGALLENCGIYMHGFNRDYQSEVLIFDKI